ncbi:hypothetical protein V757_08300 [Pelistega indica]|uniref:GTP-binding protein n=1 Tax=Pelistega indica TaxID=1414851 RepID=V8G0K9_9BURK|nr:DUF945 family protein [Pelistega indica]ETD70044.1 hypothetical protein V757_08300 [Pelistega indica]
MRVKFIIGGLILALGAIYPLASKVHGDKTQSRLENEIAEVNQYIQNTLNIKDFSFTYKKTESDIFSTHYIWSVNYQGKNIDLVEQDIEHGPLPFSRLKQGLLAPVSYSSELKLIRNSNTEPFFNAFQQENPIVINYRYGYDKKIKGTATIAPLSINDTEKKFKLTSEQHELSFNTNRELTDSSVSLNFSGMSLSSLDKENPFSLIISPGTISSQSHATKEGKLYLSNTDLDGMQLKFDEIDVAYKKLKSHSNMNDDGKQISVQLQDEYQEIAINDVPFGQLTTNIGYNRLDSAATKQLFSQLAQILKENFILALKNPSEMGNSEDIFAKNALRLGASSLALFNQKPEINYGPIRIRNKGGEASITADVGMILPELNKTVTEDVVFSMLSKINLDIQVEPSTLSQLLFDSFTLSAKINHLNLPTKDDKTELDAITHDIEKALLEAKLAEKKGNALSFTIQAEAPNGKSIKEVETINFNGTSLPLTELLLDLNTKAEKATTLLEQTNIEQRLTLLSSKFIKDEDIPDETSDEKQ